MAVLNNCSIETEKTTTPTEWRYEQTPTAGLKPSNLKFGGQTPSLNHWNWRFCAGKLLSHEDRKILSKNETNIKRQNGGRHKIINGKIKWNSPFLPQLEKPEEHNPQVSQSNIVLAICMLVMMWKEIWNKWTKRSSGQSRRKKKRLLCVRPPYDRTCWGEKKCYSM